MKPGVCMAVNCTKHGSPLTQCECADGGHEQIPGAAVKEKAKQVEEKQVGDDSAARRESDELRSGE